MTIYGRSVERVSRCVECNLAEPESLVSLGGSTPGLVDGILSKIIRCDNAGENYVLERESDKNELGIIFEYTAPGTPQQNGVVERAFVTVMGKARAMMNYAGFTMAKRQQLWCEAAQTSTMLDNIWYKTVPKIPLLLNFLE